MAIGDATPADRLHLDRMAVEEAGGADPVKLANAIHHQLGSITTEVPVHAIAAALDIEEIRSKDLSNLEGALVTTEDRNNGSILINQASRRSRQRFTFAHELGHFLNLWHRPTNRGGFHCTSRDLAIFAAAPSRKQSPHERQEIKANRFAIELLIPAYRLRHLTRRLPDLEHVLALAGVLDCSREATARRFVEVHGSPAAIIFGKDGIVRYTTRSSACSRLVLTAGDRIYG
jgi:Zn-dependent peptidase ImmA (M78 family)